MSVKSTARRFIRNLAMAPRNKKGVTYIANVSSARIETLPAMHENNASSITREGVADKGLNHLAGRGAPLVRANASLRLGSARSRRLRTARAEGVTPPTRGGRLPAHVPSRRGRSDLVLARSGVVPTIARLPRPSSGYRSKAKGYTVTFVFKDVTHWPSSF